MSEEEQYQGYRGPAKEVLLANGVAVWSHVIVHTDSGSFEGILLPRSAGDDYHIVIKLLTGYNVGIAADRVKSIEEVGVKKANYRIPEKEFPYDPHLPNVILLGTGGTIASRLDYRTGAVIPAFTPGELYGAVPELADIANITTRKLFGVFSENMGPKQWRVTAENIGKEIESGKDGIVIGHGTDTMHHTASALSFMVQNPPVPIVMVGSQRSSDRPSSDAALNLIHAVTAAATGDIAEVVVCMFGTTSDKYSFLHRGTRVRKMHSSVRNTFKTIGEGPLAKVTKEGVIPLRKDYRQRREDKEVTINTAFEERVALVYYYPNMHPDIIESLIDNGYKGIVIAGTGLGHVNKPLYKPLRRAYEEGIIVFMTVQTLWGYVQMYVYDTGRDLLAAGVIPGQNMLPEVAYVKLGWVLGQTQEREEVIKMMLTPIAGEITPREQYDGFVIGQGGLPETDEFLKKFS